MINEALTTYIEAEILPRYEGFDAAHRGDHAAMVIEQSMEIAQRLTEGSYAAEQGTAEGGATLDLNMVYTIAAYHDTGLAVDRKTHHLVSGQIVRSDARLSEWFSPEQIETMAQAVEDHRASSDHAPRSIYGRIVAEADRFIDPDKIIERTVQYGLEHYPELDREGHWQRTLAHLYEKYAEGGYLRLWFPESPNAQRLEALRAIIRDEPQLHLRFDTIYSRLEKQMIDTPKNDV